MSSTGALREYHKKRNFSHTNEPEGLHISEDSGDFMIHHHLARRDHYDLRLQWKGVLKCWAIPKGPSYSPQTKRLAIRTEDHPDDYKAFEGVIPEGEYGAGPSLIWDAGDFEPLSDFDKGLKKGHLRFKLNGVRLHGIWNLVRLNTKEKKEQWLFVKEDDEYASTDDLLEKLGEESVATGRTLHELEDDTLLPKKKDFLNQKK